MPRRTKHARCFSECAKDVGIDTRLVLEIISNVLCEISKDGTKVDFTSTPRLIQEMNNGPPLELAVSE